MVHPRNKATPFCWCSSSSINGIIDIPSGVNQWIFDNSPLQVPQKNIYTKRFPNPKPPIYSHFQILEKRCLPIFSILIGYNWNFPNSRFPNVGMIDWAEFHSQTWNNQTPCFLLSPWFWASPPYRSLSWPHWKVPPHFPPVVTFFVGRYHNYDQPHGHFLHGSYSTKGQVWAYLTGSIPRLAWFSEVSSIDSIYNLCLCVYMYTILYSVRYGELRTNWGNQFDRDHKNLSDT